MGRYQSVRFYRAPTISGRSAFSRSHNTREGLQLVWEAVVAPPEAIGST